MRQKHYDKDIDVVKASAVIFFAQSSGDSLGPAGIDEALAKKREEREERDKIAAQKHAESVLSEASQRRNTANSRSRQWNLTASEREFFQRVLRDPNNKEMAAATVGKVFPSEGKARRWTKLLYRLLDSLQSADGKRMRDIEMNLFHSKFKPDNWTDSMTQNNQADKKIAAAIRSSLQSYEKNTQAAGYKGPVFNFN